MKTLIVLGIVTLANLIYAGLNNVKVHKENPFWTCRYCGGTNASEDGTCRYCGRSK